MKRLEAFYEVGHIQSSQVGIELDVMASPIDLAMPELAIDTQSVSLVPTKSLKESKRVQKGERKKRKSKTEAANRTMSEKSVEIVQEPQDKTSSKKIKHSSKPSQVSKNLTVQLSEVSKRPSKSNYIQMVAPQTKTTWEHLKECALFVKDNALIAKKTDGSEIILKDFQGTHVTRNLAITTF